MKTQTYHKHRTQVTYLGSDNKENSLMAINFKALDIAIQKMLSEVSVTDLQKYYTL